MRESERNVGSVDNNSAGEHSTAEGETQRPNKVVEDGASAEGTRGGNSDSDTDRDSVRSDSAAMGDEGSANTSSRGGKPERKPNA